MNRFQTQPIQYSAKRQEKYDAIPVNTLPGVRDKIIKRLNAQQQKTNDKIAEKSFLQEQARFLQQEFDKEQKRIERERILQIQEQQRIEAERRQQQKRLNYIEGAKKRKEARQETKKVASNVLLDVSGVLTNLVGQIENPVKQALSKVKNNDYVVIQITVNGTVIESKLVQVQGGDTSAMWWNSIFDLIFTYENGVEVQRIQNGNTFRIVLIRADQILSQKILQKYREGETHCVLQPIYNMFMEYAKASVSPASKKRLAQIANKIKGMEQDYPNGVPENDMEIVGKACSRSIVIHDIIGNEIKRYNTSSNKYIHFTNTRINHVEQGNLVIDKSWTVVSEQEMVDLLEEHDKNGWFYLFDGDIQNRIAKSIRSVKGAFAVGNPDREIYNEFTKSQGVSNYGINAVQYPELNEFIREGRVINSTPTPLCDDPNDTDGVEHIDVEKAYTQHTYAPFYEGFLGHITNWRRLTNCSIDFITNHLGMYQIKVLTCSNILLRKLGLKEGCLYTLCSPEIKYFMSLGMTCKLMAGCWGSTFHLEWTPEMLENRRYCIWAGKQGMDKEYQTYTLKGGSEWASHLKAELGDDCVFYFSEAQMIVIKIKKTFYTTRHHILAFITCYTRLNMLELMSKVDGDLIKVVLDGLYFRGVLPDVEIPCKSKELKQHIGFRDAWYYPSTINTSSWGEYDSRFDGSAILAGAGGSGKTHSVLTSRGLIRPLYVVPSHVLGRKMIQKHGGSYTTINKLIGMECVLFKTDHYEPHVILLDELTMIEAEWIDQAVKMYPNTMFLIAGDVDEKQWYQCRNGCPGKFSKIWNPKDWKYVHYTTDYRSRDEELKAFKEVIRNVMKQTFKNDNMFDIMAVQEYIMANCKVEHFKDAVAKHVEGDTWIAGTHSTNRKLLMNDVVSGYINSDKEIVAQGEGEQRGSFTIHSFQGLTIETGKVFICISDIFEYAMIYTAVSRCVNMSQIVFFYHH
jgi:hypothetical protein